MTELQNPVNPPWIRPWSQPKLLPMGSKKNRRYKKKPRFYGNRYCKFAAEQENNEKAESDQNTKVNQPESGTPRPTYNEFNVQEKTPRSSKRVRLDILPEKGQQVEDLNYNIINFMVLKKIVNQIGNCPVCQEKVTIESMLEKRMGYAHNLRSKCTSCSWETI